MATVFASNDRGDLRSTSPVWFEVYARVFIGGLLVAAMAVAPR